MVDRGTFFAGWPLLTLPIVMLAGCGAASPNKDANSTATQQSRSVLRLRSGLWESVSVVNGHTMAPAQSCVGDAEAAAINGDDASVRAGLTKTNAANGCRLENLRIAGPDIAFDTICSGQRIHSALNYRGETYTGTMTFKGGTPMALRARRIGACGKTPPR